MSHFAPRVATTKRKLVKGKGSQPHKSAKVPCPECHGAVKLKNLKSHRGNQRKCPMWMKFRPEPEPIAVRRESVRETVSAGRTRSDWQYQY